MADLLGTFEHIVLLAVLRQGEEAYGRSILREVETALSDSRSVSAGAVYSTLDRLEEKGMLRSKLGAGTPERGGRQRRFYRVTSKGSAAMAEAKSVLENLWQSFLWPLEVKA